MRALAVLALAACSTAASLPTAGSITQIHVGAREAWVYAPPGYDPGRTYPLLVCFDGSMYVDELGVPAVLDDLAARGVIAPTLAVFVGQSENRTPELSNDPKFLAYVTDELLPAVRTRWHATTDPRDTIACGASAGGLASAFAALRRPDVFGNVLSQSGAFWRGASYTDTDYEWLTHQYARTSRLAVRFALDVGSEESRATPSGASILEANRRLHAVLVAAGYAVRYREIPGGVHAPQTWRAAFPEALVALRGLR